jgi:hypothetical protein
MNELLAALGIKKAALLAGLIGGVVSLRFFEGLTGWGKVVTALGGAAFANYLAGPASEYLAVSASHEGGVGFVLGLFGMSVAAAGIKAVRDVDWAGVIKGKIG